MVKEYTDDQEVVSSNPCLHAAWKGPKINEKDAVDGTLKILYCSKDIQ